MQIRPAAILSIMLVMTLAGVGIVIHDDHSAVRSAVAPWNAMDPNKLFSNEVVTGFENGPQAVIVVSQKTADGQSISAGPQTLYLRAANGARSAAWFPQTTSSSQVWAYAAFDDTPLADALAATMEYGSQSVSYSISDEKENSWTIRYEQEGRTVHGTFPTDAIVNYRAFNLLFINGDQIVFADTISEEVRIGSPLTFTYEAPFDLPAFDRIEARLL